MQKNRAPGPSPVPVLLLVRKLGWGGIERDVAKIVVGIDRTRFSPHVAVFEDGGLRSDEVKRAGVPVLNLNVTTYLSPRILATAWKFCRWVHRHRIRVVHAYDATIIFAAPLARLLRIPLVLASTLGHRDLYDPRTRKQVPFTDPLIDGMVVNCQAMRKHLVDDYHFPADRILLCYNGVETSEFYPLPGPKPEPVQHASLVIGSVCVLRPEKRMEMLIEAFAPVARRHRGLELLIVGSGPELPKLQARAAELGVTDLCKFVPAVTHVAPYLRAMDIFVSCSNSEAFSNAILEAMACGCCPVGSRVGGTPELIEDGERGLLFPAHDVSELSQTLGLLVENHSLRQQYARRAAHFAAHNLNMQIALDCLGRIYTEGLARKGDLS